MDGEVNKGPKGPFSITKTKTMAYDNIARAYLQQIIETKSEPLHVYHAGTFTGGEYNPWSVGEPGNMRPMGSGIYAGDTEYHAGRYLKFGGEKAKVHKFEVHPDAKIFPMNTLAWRQETPEMQTHWREKSQAIEQDFRDAGLVRSKHGSWSSALLYSTSVPEREHMRQILLKHGVDAGKQVFGDEPGATEYAFYNTNVLKHVD